MNKHILHLLGSLSIGGAENLVLDLLRYNKECANASLKFYLVYMHKSVQQRVTAFEQALGDASLLHFIKCEKGLINTFSFIKNLRKFIKEHEINVIHCHNNIDAYWAYLACGADVESGKVKIMLSIHGLNLNFRYLSLKSSLLKGLESKIISKLQISFVSALTKDFYINKCPDSFSTGQVIYNGVDWKRFDNEAGKGVKNLENQEWMNDGRKVFAMVGNFNTQVRLQKMICQAMCQISPASFVFVFIGKKIDTMPQKFDDCVSLCSQAGILDKDVFFLGGREDVPAILKKISAYVYASSGDTFGLSVVEAAGSGVPVICSDIQTFREILLNGKLGTLVNNSPNDFANAMINLFNKLSEQNADTEFVKQKVRELYSVEKCFKTYYL